MTRVLVTGMSATGKSTIVAELAARGYRTVDADDGWCVYAPDGEWIWNEDLIEQLLAEDCDDVLFVAGTASNQRKFRDRFDHIILLSAPLDVMIERLNTRTTNPFGKSADQLAAVLTDTHEVVPLLRCVADLEVDTRGSIADVVDSIIAHVTFDPSAPDDHRLDPLD